MKKVALITLHRVTNFGSLLQTYATQTALTRLSCEVEVIDYVPRGLTFREAVFPGHHGSLPKKLVKLLPLLAVNAVQFRMTNRFLKKHIALSKRRYSSYGELLAAPPAADIYMSGSDQIWNTQNNNAPDDIMAYYLCFAPKGAPRLAYAGSFGKTELTPEEQATVGDWLSTYRTISVREDTALTLLESVGIRNGVHVVDPTLLLSAKEWLAFCGKKPPRSGYVFVYNLNRNRLAKELARRLAEEKGLRIVNFSDSLDFIGGARNRFGNTPQDFLNFLAHADYVVTDSFHGTAFSLNLEKQVFCVPAPRYNSRLESLLRKLSLLNTRLVHTVEEGLSAMETEIDYSTVTPQLEAFREASWSFLTEALSYDDE